MTIGQVKNISLDLTQPAIKVDEMTLKEIAIFVGANGVGKTMVMLLIWILSTVINSIITFQQHGIVGDAIEAAQELFNGSFDSFDFSGTVTTHYDNGSIKVYLDKGKVVDIETSIDDKVDTPSIPIFMSKTMRTFEDIKKYLKFRKILGITNLATTTQVETESLQEMYKIYDIIYVEKLLASVGDGISVPESLLQAIHEFSGMERHDIQKIYYDDDLCSFVWQDSDDNTTDFATMSAGEQSLCNIFIAQNLDNV